MKFPSAMYGVDTTSMPDKTLFVTSEASEVKKEFQRRRQIIDVSNGPPFLLLILLATTFIRRRRNICGDGVHFAYLSTSRRRPLRLKKS